MEVACVDCKAWACFPDVSTAKTGKRESPPYCPANVQQDVCEAALAKYSGATKEFARVAALVENACYAIDPSSGSAVLPMITTHSRAEEIILFAKVAGYNKLGIVYCTEMQQEASLYTDVLENNGFDVVAICCKAGAIPKEKFGVAEGEKLYGASSEETACNGVILAELLNADNTDMNVVMGLCVGQDALLYKYADAFSLPFIVADRVYGGATMEGAYQVFNSWGYRNFTDEIGSGFDLMRAMMVNRLKRSERP